MQQEVLGLVEHVLLLGLGGALRHDGLDHLDGQRHELAVFDAPVVVLVGLGHEPADVLVAEVEPVGQHAEHLLELGAVEVAAVVGVGLEEQLGDHLLQLLRRHVAQRRAAAAAALRVAQPREVLVRVLVDVRRLVAQHLAREILQDVGEPIRDGEFPCVFRRHIN